MQNLWNKSVNRLALFLLLNLCYIHHIMELQPLTSSEIRSRFLQFFEKRGHAILPSASLVPENDPSVLFNTAGMQPLVPYLMGQKHPLGNRLASCQKCVRTGDLDDIGDNRHFSFFEMLGNWSLGDYFKDEAIKWSYEFLTSKDEGLGLDPNRLAVTIFQGDENAPFDQESKDIWMSLGIPEHRIYALPADDNWWSPGDNGPCGPCSEMFYDMDGRFIGQELSHDDFIEQVQQENFIEIWNDVFMEYEKKDGTVIGKLTQRNVDTGAGLERLTAVMQGKKTAYDTDLFEAVQRLRVDDLHPFDKDTGLLINDNLKIRSARIAFDHFRTALFMASDDVTPSNKDRGYIMRRLIRRGIIYWRNIINSNQENYIFFFRKLMQPYKGIYPELFLEDKVFMVILNEISKFQKTLDAGLKEFSKGVDPFILATTYGFPIELTEELAAEKGIVIDRAKFDTEMKAHQELSRSGSEQKFKGGLGGTSDKIIRSHTAHHLLLAALRQVLGAHVHQRGSNITDERIRIDFAHDAKMTDEQKAEVEKLVNEWIASDMPMQRVEMPRDQAEKIGAEMEFGVKYPDMVSIYFIGDDLDHAISKEFCGGPHIEHTGLIGTFKIQKEEASSAGVRRIKATIE
jgi:alanyl-tRNA synthetase